MKILVKNFSALCFALIIISFIRCGSDPKPAKPEPTEKERVTGILTANGGSWAPPASAGITVGGTDVTVDLFKDFSIKFSENTFTTTGTSPVWLRQDTWSFKDETAKVMIRGQDSKEITIVSISDTQLKLSLQWDKTTTEGGRQKSVPGKYEFTLNK